MINLIDTSRRHIVSTVLPQDLKYDSSMTRRITVSLPDDVAQYLDKHPNSSAVVADAVRARMERGAAVAAALRAAGVDITDAGIDAARGALPRSPTSSAPGSAPGTPRRPRRSPEATDE
ncbi:hypothetical protein Asp14428_61620 [Actinoplanes sp. NBRC 14428]|nr:hypothetical protein Asp14428_61620 [Actinoplanes sp. NBRC 14428]